MTVAVAVAQFAPVADTGRNIAEIAELAAVAADRGARVVVLPEYSSYFVDPFDASLRANAQPVDGPFTAALREIATAHGVTVVAGLLEVALHAAIEEYPDTVGQDVQLVRWEGYLRIARLLRLAERRARRGAHGAGGGGVGSGETGGGGDT